MAGQALGLVLGMRIAPGIASAGAPAFGRLEIRITDHREAIAEFASLRVSIPTVALHRRGAPRTQGWIEIPATTPEVDLVRHVGGPGALLLTRDLDPGEFDAIRLTIRSPVGVLKRGKQVPVAAHLPAAGVSISVRSGRLTVCTVDLAVLDIGDHPGGGYELVIRRVHAATRGAIPR
ncbi:MAG: DUF4382 domain-containing protein, partial [Deltaproteobacteria bacterium]|nr:DUF4382 domain-containing protein [Deltaproteobacteria bacterium]